MSDNILIQSGTGTASPTSLWAAIGSGLSYSAGTLTATGGGGGSSTLISRTFAWALGLDSNAVVSTDQSPWVVCNTNGTFSRWDLAAKTAPVGANLVLDFFLSSDGGSTWTSLWHANPSNRPTIAAGSHTGNGTSFDITSFSAGNLIRQDVAQIGSSTAGSNISAAILAGPLGLRTFAWALGTNSNVVVSTDQSPWVICNTAGSFARWDMAVKTAPTGADLILDFLISTDGGSTWTSLWHTNPSNRPTIAAGSNTGTGSAFDITSFAAGNLIRQDVIQVGSIVPGNELSATILGAFL